MTSVWILGDQLLEPHPAMAHARAGGERVRARALVLHGRRIFSGDAWRCPAS